ncbi:virulence protein E [Comamonas sp. NyZ500]|uniref:VapE domain-containing protein n=1 Tax=Comamonas sp. NyZ500 TaxID=2795732 RepID=UPI00192B57EB|nr:VapE domain-containing protein [Comamonas sp. NyZ500]MBL5979060.1 virulence protein E [Comamonas sp. NyZ500]
MSQHREPLPPIQFGPLRESLLADAENLVPRWLPGGQFDGHEYRCADLSGGHGHSCSVNVKTGKWADFATGEQGNDLIGLYAAIHGLSNAKAAIQVAREEKLESVAGLVKQASGAAVVPAANPRPAPAPKADKTSQKEEWSTLRPVPENAQQPTFAHHHRQPQDLEHKAEYRVGDDLHGFVMRYRTSDDSKDTLPYTFCSSARDGSRSWKWKTWDEPRPLYFPSHALPDGRTVILVEGELKADVLQQVLDAVSPGIYCVASWAGGSKAWKKAGWDWLARATVLLWPDCDAQRERLTRDEQASVKDDPVAKEALQLTKPLLPAHKQPGMGAMLGIGAHLVAEQGCTVQLLPIPEPGAKPSGWDCKDAITDEGWTGEDVLAFFGRAQPLPVVDAPADAPAQADAPAPAGGSGGKPPKSDDPVGTGGTDDDDFDDDMVKIGGYLVPSWMSYYYDSEKSRWNVSRKFVIRCLERLPDIKDVLGFDELRNTVQCRKAWPWPYAKPGEVRNADSLLLGKWLTDTYGLPSISKAALEEGMLTVAATRRYHPIRDYLTGLTWDGKPRVDNWLVHVLGEKPDTIKPALFEYLGLVGRFWLLGMVYRVMEPGCKFDYCPVLEGNGGLRKSTLVETLATSEYFSDTPFEVGKGKEAQEQVQGLWLYEIAELTHFSKSEVGAIKAFISAKVDRYRVAYGSTVESFPRQCVLVGTTNEDTYLRDRTGNRRFWPIPVKRQINTEFVAKYREQLLAEAFARYLQGEAYSPTGEQEERLFKPMQESRLVETAVDGELLYVLTRVPMQNGIQSVVNELADFVTLPQLVQALGADPAKAPPGLQGQITSWLKHEGWERKRSSVAPRPWGYVRPKNWPPQERVGGLDEQAPAMAPAAVVEEGVTYVAPPLPADFAPDHAVAWDGDDAPF